MVPKLRAVYISGPVTARAVSATSQSGIRRHHSQRPAPAKTVATACRASIIMKIGSTILSVAREDCQRAPRHNAQRRSILSTPGAAARPSCGYPPFCTTRRESRMVDRGAQGLWAGMARPDLLFEAFAAREPYFAVLTAPKYRLANLTPDAEREFFASGEAVVDWIFHVIETRIAPRFSPMSTLEYGCGPGRLALPLARRPGSVTAVDRSPAMLAAAQ